MTDVQPTEEREPKLEKVPGGWLGRFRCGATRKRVVIAVADERLAYARARRMREVIRALVAAKKSDDVVRYLEQAAAAPNSPAFNGVCKGALLLSKDEPTATGPCTFRDICEMWLSGMLHMRFPKTVPSQTQETAENSRARIVRHIYPHIGDLAARNIGQSHYDAVMAKLPKTLQCRDKIAGFMVRVLDHAVRLKLIDKNPIDPNTVPPPRDPNAVAFTYLYPDEDERLLSCELVPLGRRAFYGVLTRNGFRSSEAGNLRVGDVDFANGTITLDDNKTTPRCWQADDDVLRALRRLIPTDAEPGDKVFPWYDRRGLSAQLRRDLKTAGVDRRNLFVKSDKRRPIRIHDLRATFVTLAMAAGRNEKWVKQRTGHTTSIMLSRYERRAGDATEAGHNHWLGDLEALLWPKDATPMGRGVGQVISIQRKKAGSRSSSTTADPLQVHAGTTLSRESDPPAGRSKRGGPPPEGGAGQSIDNLTAAIASASAAGRWAIVDRLTAQLEGLKAASG